MASTFKEHQALIGNEHNPERWAFHEFGWHLGGAQSDVAIVAGLPLSAANVSSNELLNCQCLVSS